MKIITIFLGALLAIFIIFTHSSGLKRQACINNTCFDIELADNDYERYHGLMFRKALGSNRGMLFIFDNQARHKFWMKNMNLPLDIIWIANDRKIIDIYKNASPCKEDCESFAPKQNAKYVLEINSGIVDRDNIKIGNKVKLNF